MATLPEIEQHRSAVQALIALAQRDLLAFWRSLDKVDPQDVARAVLAVMPELIDGYGETAAELGATWFEDLRDASPASGSYLARTPDLPPLEQVEALARWGVGPLFATAPNAVGALSRLAGGMQRLVAGQDRAAVELNASLDKAGPVYMRHASANACAFCRMLASRGAVYGSEASATTVVGRGGVARGLQPLGRKFHDHCHCTSVPVWPGQELEQASYTADWAAAYTSARDAVGGDTTAILAELRRTLDAA